MLLQYVSTKQYSCSLGSIFVRVSVYAVNTDVCNPDRVNCRFRGCIALQQIEDNFADKNVYKFVQNEQEMYSELIRIVRK